MYFNARVSTLQLITRSISKLTQSATFSLIVLFALGSFSGFGQGSIYSNPITGTNPNSANPYTSGQVVSAGITVSGIGRGTGITGKDAINRYNASGWNSSNLNSSNYFEWTITPNSCKEIDFTSFVYTSERSGTSGVVNSFSFRSSVDGYANNIGSPDFDGTTIDLSAFQNITTAITFRFYAWGASSDTRTFSINDFQFNGTIANNASPVQFPALANGDYVWTGVIDGNWSTNENWSIYNSTSNTFSPASNDPDASNLNVFIPPISSCNSYGFVIARNCILDSDRDVKNITILDNGQLSIDDTDDLGVFGNWINNGSFYHNDKVARVDFENATTTQIIGGSSVTEFYRLEISANNTNNVIANQSIKVNNHFKFAENRKFELGNNSIEFLGASTISNESNLRYFVTNGTGVVKRTLNNSTLKEFPVGINTYNLCLLNNTGTSDVFSVRVIENVTDDGTGIGATTDAAVVNRTWMISEMESGGSISDLQLFWNGPSDEINNFDAGFAFVAHHNGTNWENLGGDDLSISPLFIQKNDLADFSPYTIGANVGSPLPVELTSFNAICEEGKGVKVAWSTASEHNSSHFDVLKSEDGYNWRSIATVSAAGNAMNTISYGIVDFEKANGVSYYKLMQYDIDGASKEYGPISSDCYHLEEMVVKTFPNPSGDEFYVELISPEATSTVITIIDAQGKAVYTRTVETEKGTNLYTFESLNVLPGMYYIQISNDLATPNVVKHSFR